MPNPLGKYKPMKWVLFKVADVAQLKHSAAIKVMFNVSRSHKRTLKNAIYLCLHPSNALVHPVIIHTDQLIPLNLQS